MRRQTLAIGALCLLGAFSEPNRAACAAPQGQADNNAASAAKARAGRIYLLSIRCLGETGDTATAIEGFQACIKSDPTFVPAYLQLSEAYDRKQDWAASIRTLTDLLAVETEGGLRVQIQERITALKRMKDSGKPPIPSMERLAEVQMRLASGDFSGALALTFGPGADDSDPLGYLISASIAQALGSPSRAVPLLDEALKRIPEGARADVKRLRDEVAAAMPYERLRNEATAAMRRGDYTDAFDAWHQVLRSPLVDRNVLESFAFAADAIRQYAPAVATLEQRALVLDPSLAQVARDQALRLKSRAALQAKAKGLADIGRRVLTASPDYSARNYLAALKIDPANVDYLMGFALACRKGRKSEAAMEAVQQAAATGAYSTSLAEGVGILASNGAADEANRLTDRLGTEAKKRSPDAQIELAEALITAKQNTAAATILGQIPTETPKRGLVARMRAQCLFADKDYAGAEAAFQKALVADPENGANYADLAGAQFRQGHKDEAKKSAVEAIKRGVKDHWVFKELLGGK